MRLEKIEIKGFKSFADATVVYFNRPVTGIVGPNGSGKSNIVDAFRWVLGEQKGRDLRLEKMSDVIFNGSEKRKKGRFARVELTFSNTKNILPIEYQSVTVSRELDQQGASDYKINGVTCRLKDIRNLFSDTGIGPDSYAIIALQMVENLLQNKNNDRRKMFEQAAGISKYKMRKKETYNKLKLTESDLERLEDLLYEIDGNLKSLERQARRTKRFNKIQDQYRELSLDLARLQLETQHSKLENLNNKLLTEKQKLTEKETAKAKLEAKIESEKKSLLTEEVSLSSGQKELNQLLDEVRNAETVKNDTASRLKYLYEKLEEYVQNIKKNTDQINRYEQELVEVEEEVGEKLAAVECKKEEHKRAEKAHALLENKFQVYRKKQKEIAPVLHDTEEKIHQSEKKLAILENDMTRLEENRQHITQKAEDLKSSFSDLNTKKDKYTERIQVLEERREVLVSQIAEKQNEQERRREHKEKLQQNLSKVNRTIDALSNEVNLLQSMIDNLEGFPESIKYLKKESNWAKNSILFSDLINCPENVRMAIESFLEPYLNHFVVGSEEDAYHAIKLLTGAQKGRGQFFVLSRFDELRETPAHPQAERVIDLLEIEPRYEHLIKTVLHKVYIAPVDAMKEIDPRQGEVFLSTEGHLIRSATEVRGGSVGLFGGKKIGRKKHVAQLNERIKSLTTDKEDLNRELNSLSTQMSSFSIEELKTEQNSVQDEIQEISSAKRLVQHQINQNQAEIQKLQSESEKMKLKVHKQKAEKTELEQGLKELRVTVKENRKRIRQAELFLNENEVKLDTARKELNTAEIEMIKSSGALDTVQQECSFRKNQIASLTDDSMKLEDKLYQSKEELKELKEKQEKIRLQLQELYEQKEKKTKGISEQEEAYYAKRGEINEIEEHLRKLQSQYLQHQSLVNQMKDGIASTRYEIKNIEDRVEVEFKIKLAQHELPEIDEEEALKLTVKRDKLQSRIENYGEINPLAVEAYDEMNTRKEHIESERDDILEAKKDLINTIKEIDQAAKERFMSAFEKINVHFKKVFRSLFGKEDDCQLILSDSEDPLESEIEIIAKPKGKRPKSLSQLSGGEKTLTATALLFSLYLLKPAPFCIFDEVDAPLDDSNIQKFNNIIREFSAESQFIVITHNKQTMTAMDVVYGVFMDQPGVSRVGAVDFNEIDYAKAG